MSDVRNRANSLDVSFPIPGVNNSSQGFRDNTSVTQQALFSASDEITKLQNTQLRFVGDAQGTSGRLDSAVVVGANDPTLEIPFVLSNTLLASQTFNSNTSDAVLTFDIKGRLTGYQTVNHTINFAPGHTIGQLVPISGNIGSGSGTINLPVFGFNALGRLITTGIQAVDFGLLNQTLTRGSILVGGLGNVSTELAPPSGPGTFVLSATGATLSWVAMPSGGGGGSTNVIGGTGILVTTVLDTATVSLDLGDLDLETSIASQDQLIFRETSGDAKRIAFDDLRDLIVDSLGPFELVSDTSPQLGGNLNVQNFSITSSTAVGIQAPTVALQAPSLTLNGLIFPTTSGAVGQVLAQGAGSQLVWSAGTSFQQTFLNTIFVGPNGSDTLGDGSFGLPYATISRALSAIPNNVPQPYTIMLLGGEYTEDVDIQNKENVAIEGFFGSTNSVIKGNVQVLFNVDSLLMSKITIDTSNDDITNIQSTFSILGGVGRATFRDCSFLRGPGPKSDLTAVLISGQLGGDVNFTNCIIQGKIDNVSQAGSNRVIFQNCGLPEDGWTGLSVGPESSTLISGAPLMKGIEHQGGVLVMENVGSVIPENYSVNIQNPSLPLWDGGRPKFLTNLGNEVFDDDILPPGEELLFNQGDDGNGGIINVETLLLDPAGDPIEDPLDPGQNLTTPFVQVLVSQPDTVLNFNVGLFSRANSNTSSGDDRLELTNVNFYNAGEFSKIYKEGSCEWSFNRVQRRSDQDFILGPRIAYDVQPDQGNFIGQYTASGVNLRYLDTNTVVPGGHIDPASGNTFLVNLTSSATLTLKTPLGTSYSPGPGTLSGEFYTEVLIGVQQDSVGYRQLNFVTSPSSSIEWLGNNTINSAPDSLTFYLFRYFSRSRTWVGQKQVDSSGLRVRPITNNAYTLAATDANSYIRRSSPGINSVIVPLNTEVEFNVGTQIHIVQIGPGSTEIQSAPGVIVNTPLGYRLRNRYSTVTLTKVAINTWDLSGDLDPTSIVAPQVTVDDNLITVDSDTVDTTGV